MRSIKLFITMVSILIFGLSLSACVDNLEFTINFDSNGGTEVSSVTTNGSSTVSIPDDPTKEGFIFGGWYWDNDLFNQPFTANSLLDSPLSSNMTVYAKWITDETYIPDGYVKVSFDSTGGTIIQNKFVESGRTMSIPTVSKNGYTLEGWYTSLNGGQTLDEKWSFTSSIVNNEITLYAKWQINTYTITYNLNGGTELLNPMSYNIEDLTFTLNDPIKEGYTFAGWNINPGFDGEVITSIEYGSFGDLILHAKWLINQYTIYFNSNGGSLVDPITQDFDTSILEPTEPIREGYTFAGWYSNESLTNRYVFNKIPSQNIILYAKWNLKTYIITYNLNGGINGYNPASYQITSKTITLEDPTKEGYTFGGWFDSEELLGTSIYCIESSILEDIILYAHWTINSYTITYKTYDDYNPLNDIFLEAGETIAKVSLGSGHSSALTSLGRMFTWGYNYYGQLGDGTTITRYKPTEITTYFSLNTGETITEISLGYYHSSALTSLGRIFTWGGNAKGRLGDGTTTDRHTPIDITSHFSLITGEKVTKVFLGANNSSALTSLGRIFTWGFNNFGELGDGTTITRYTPTEITTHFSFNIGEKITDVSLGITDSTALTSLGRIFIWGSNSSSPSEITSSFNLNSSETITQVSLGGSHSSALTSLGRIFTWGSNNYGQLGDGTTIYNSSPTEITAHFDLSSGETITQVSLGGSHSSALTSLGRIFTWGSNNYGQIGSGTTIYNSSPTEITAHFDLSSGETITQVSLGGSHSSALTSLGRIFTWGFNNYGQLGLSTITSKSTPQTLVFNSTYSAETVARNFNESLIEYIPTRSGYTFDGWYSDTHLTNSYSFVTMPATNLVLYGKWIPVN